MNEITPSNTDAMSQDIRLLAQSFLAARKEFLKTGKGGKNEHQKYAYAKIEDIYNAIEEGLSNHNIIIWHFSRPEAGLEYLHTRLIHTLSGQYIEDRRILESEKPGNQAKGSANTYMKKYAVLSLCAIATEDDDGQAEQKHIEQKDNEPCISETQERYLRALLDNASNKEELHKYILKAARVKAISQMKAYLFEDAKAYIKSNAKE